MSDVQATELEVEESKCNAAAPAQNGLAATNNKETGCDCKNVCAGLVQRKLQEEHLMLSTSPYKPETHWKQSLFYINEELPVVQDSVICGNLKIDHCKENRRFLNISLHCKVDDRKDVHQSYYMGYELPEKVENNQWQSSNFGGQTQNLEVDNSGHCRSPRTKKTQITSMPEKNCPITSLHGTGEKASS